MAEQASPFPKMPLADDNRGAYSDPAPWSCLVDEASDLDYFTSWLQLMSKIISGVMSGVVVLSQGEEAPFLPVAIWPAFGGESPQKHAAVIERAVREKKGVVIREGTENGDSAPVDSPLCVAFPVRRGDRILAIVALRLLPRSGEPLQTAMRQLQWGAAWVENRMLRKEAEQCALAEERMSTALDFIAGVVEEPKFNAAASSVATLLATRFQADRVSIGFVKGRHVKIRALSHSSQFKDRMNLIRSIGSAMEECLDQECPIAVPSAEDTPPLVSRAHEELSAQYGDCAVCSVPFFDSEGKGLGAITLERPLSAPFTINEIQLSEAIASVLGPLLEEKRRLDRPVAVHAVDAVREQLKCLFGARHLVYKTVCLLLVVLVLFFSFVEGDYRISAKTTMEGSVVRAITAPYDGFISDAPVRPGDVVRKGEKLARLDDREKRLERIKVQSRREQYLRQYRQALATGNRSEMMVLRQQMEQDDVQIRLLNDQIGKSVLAAPFDAVVVSGDLSQSLGAPVERSKVLFEVAPLEAYRVRLHVDEQRISDLRPGQKGTVVLNSLPNSKFPITLTKITPVSVTTEGKNQFMVEASLDQVSNRIRPGMEGVGKVFVERRLLIWIWTHELLDWLRLWAWSWLP